MNGQMGYTGSPGVDTNPGYRRYYKGSDLTCPTPANAFVFLDESPASLQDGYFQLRLFTPGFSDVPAAYLEGGCGFSFADGHGEIHRWQTANLAIPVVRGLTLSSVDASGLNVDWIWLRQRSACLP